MQTSVLGRSSEAGRIVRRAHDYLFKQAGLDPAHAYDEILRCLASLTHSRSAGEVVTGGLGDEELRRAVENRADALLAESKIQAAEPLAFGPPSVDAEVLRALLAILDELTGRLEVEADVFGTIFQEVVTSTFRGSLGAYFTPSPIADLIASVVEPEDGDLVVDSAAGSGGLVAAVRREALAEGHEIRVATQDINPRMVLTQAVHFQATGAKVESLRLGDGLVDSPCPEGVADIVVANPPFAGFESRPDVLSKFDFARSVGVSRSFNKTLPFVESLIRLLRPGGRAGFVLPISIFNAEEASFVELRRWVFENCEIDGVVELPTVAFEHTDCGIAGGLLFVTRKPRPRRAYPIAMLRLQAVGYDSLGYPIRDNDLPWAADVLATGEVGDLSVSRDEIQDGERIDPNWWSPSSRLLRAKVSQGDENLVPLTELCRVVKRPLNKRGLSDDELISYFEVRDTDPEFGVVVDAHHVPGQQVKRKGRIKQIARAGDVLLPNHKDSLTSKAGDGRGRSAVLVSEAFDGMATTDRFIILEPACDPNYLIAVLNSPNVRDQIVMQARGSASLDVRDHVLQNVYVVDPSSLPDDVVHEVSKEVADYRALRDEMSAMRERMDALAANLTTR